MQTFLNIVIFVVCLCLVICIHELGHLLVAKACNVYCFEYSIGFGPAIFKHHFKHKRKKKINGKPVFVANEKGECVNEYEIVKGETQFAIRCIPLGGYVSMAGEDGEVPDGTVVVPKERTINGVNHFKQICIMLAGIAMNFILAIVLFTISAWCPYTENNVSSPVITVSTEEGYKAQEYLKTGDEITYLYQEYFNLYDDSQTVKETPIVFPQNGEENTIDSYQKALDPNKPIQTYEDLSTNCISYALLDVFTAERNELFSLENTDFKNLHPGAESYRVVHLKTKESTDWIDIRLESVDKEDHWEFELLGISVSTSQKQRTFKEGLVYGGQSFSQLFVGIYQAIGSLFTPSGWQNVGGIISVYKLSASGVNSGSMSQFLYLWAYISLNLGCFNLLPFPGLDGWQTLLALGETATRKKASQKFKSIANTIGMILLFALAAVLIVKDVIMYI